jgi:UDPglucose 6-dehydrogenase
LISSQVPVGTTRKLQQLCAQQFPNKNITFACSPENLRLGKAIDVFTKPDRVVVGLQTDTDKTRVQQLLKPFTDNIVWMSIESAEMTKHALNAFLATSVVFINELSTLCEQVGANAREVELGLKSEERIGPKAYLRPGNAIAGGTLARDVNFLIQIGQQKTTATPLFSALLESNHAHKQWACRRIIQVLRDLKNKTIATLGLTYKVGTDTLRRSTAVETCEWLSQQGANVVAYDPALKELPTDITKFIQLKNTLTEALKGADAIVISTECPEFTALNADTLVSATNQPLIFDASGFLAKNLSHDARVRYFSVGRQT